uniref:RPAP1/MINIYO-like TPR repeats domain-containing protein n=1 Tax=Calcidiscus leptoporus TaxID=127549 RepID=A0A7S0NXE7_9EUKA
MPWCDMVAKRVLLPLSASPALREALDVVLAAAAPPPRPRALVGHARLVAAMEMLLGYSRLWWQLTRLHRGLLTAMSAPPNAPSAVATVRTDAAEAAAACDGVSPPGEAAMHVHGRACVRSPRQQLLELSDALPAAVGLDGNGAPGADGDPTAQRSQAAAVLRTAARLSHYVLLLLDACESVHPAGDGKRGDGWSQLAACALSWAQPADEEMARALLSCSLLSSQGVCALGGTVEARDVRAAVLPSLLRLLDEGGQAAQLQARARAQPHPEKLSSLRVGRGQARLPLPADWLTAPTRYFATDEHDCVEEAQLLAQVLASLQLLLLFLRRAPLAWLPPSRLLCRCLHVYTLPAAPWADGRVSGCLGEILESLCLQDPQQALSRSDLLGAERAVDVATLLESVLSVYSAESYGDAIMTQWVLLALRTAEPESLRIKAWAALDELAHKVVVAPPPRTRLSAWLAPIGGFSDGDRLLEAFERSLTLGNLAAADPRSFLYQLAVHHLSAAAFGAAPSVLTRLLLSAPRQVCIDVCCARSLDVAIASRAEGTVRRERQVLPLHNVPAVVAALAECADDNEDRFEHVRELLRTAE